MKNKKNIIIIAIIIVVIGIMVFNPSKYSSAFMKKRIEHKELNRSTFAIYKELTEGGSNWTLSEDTKFPDKGYVLNTNKTECHGYNDEPIDGVLTQNDDMSITISSNKTIYCNIYFDKDDTAPVVNKFNIIGKDSSNNNLTNGYTYQYGVTYEIGWDDSDVKEYCISSNNIECNGEWIKTNGLTSITTGVMNLPENEGLKTMYLFIKDKANNISTITEVSTKQITVDRTAPEVKTLTLIGTPDNTNTLTNNTLYTHTTNVNYVMNWDNEDVANYCISNTNTCSDYKVTNGKSQSGTVVVANVEGEKTVYAYIADKTNNWSLVKTSTITLDLTVPTVIINKQSVTTESITVTLEGADGSGSGINDYQCRISTINSGIWKDATLVGGKYQCTIGGLQDGMTYEVEGRTIDKSGRVSTTQKISDTTEKKIITALDLTKEENKPNGLSDNLLGDMYRFVGTKDRVNNYVCFGYDSMGDDCLTGEANDYIYRIIGITPGGQLKLIKYTPLVDGDNNVFQWDVEGNNDVVWPETKLFLRLNGKLGGSESGCYGDTNLFIDSSSSNVTYIRTKGDTTWYDKIEKDHSWWYGAIYPSGSSGVNQTAETIYQIETGRLGVQQNAEEEIREWSVNQKISAAIGLMYISDMYYSYASSGTDSSLNNCLANGLKCNRGWLTLGQSQGAKPSSEWSMTNGGKSSSGVLGGWHLGESGGPQRLGIYFGANNGGVRPVFYLTSEASRISGGTGTASDPFIIVK